jgi:hypothetical protein
MKNNKLNHLSFINKSKLRTIEKLLPLDLFIQKRQLNHKLKSNSKSVPAYGVLIDSPIFKSPKTERWSKYILGVNVLTTKFIPIHHMPSLGYSIRTLIAFIALKISCSLMGTLTKHGIENLVKSKSRLIKPLFIDG